MEWYVKANDLVGGWSIMLEDKPPSESQLEIATCLTKEIAEHIVWLHNDSGW